MGMVMPMVLQLMEIVEVLLLLLRKRRRRGRGRGRSRCCQQWSCVAAAAGHSMICLACSTHSN
jgi:hypothetical protein